MTGGAPHFVEYVERLLAQCPTSIEDFEVVSKKRGKYGLIRTTSFFNDPTETDQSSIALYAIAEQSANITITAPLKRELLNHAKQNGWNESREFNLPSCRGVKWKWALADEEGTPPDSITNSTASSPSPPPRAETSGRHGSPSSRPGSSNEKPLPQDSAKEAAGKGKGKETENKKEPSRPATTIASGSGSRASKSGNTAKEKAKERTPPSDGSDTKSKKSKR